MDHDFFDKIQFNARKPFKGSILISEPLLEDPYFRRTVVYLVEHDDQGSLGFIINKPLEDLTINDALEDFPDFDAPLFFGGPVEQESLFFVHNLGEKLEGATMISEGLYWGGDFERLKLMIELKQIDGSQLKFFTGYSGWGAGQLEEELEEKSWIVANDTPVNILGAMDKNYWKTTMAALGKKFALMSKFPEDPSMN